MEKASPTQFATAPAFSLSASAADMRRTLEMLAKNVESGWNTIPILGAVCLEFREGALEISHRGLDMRIGQTVKAEGEGALALPMRALASFVRGADGETVTINRKKDAATVEVACGAFRANIIPMHIEDAPDLKPLETGDNHYRALHLPEGSLAWLLDLTVPFISTEETRYYLNGVAFEVAEDAVDKLKGIATNGHYLGTRSASLPVAVKPFAPRIVPVFAVRALGRIAKGKEVFAELGEFHARFTMGDTILYTKLIDGTFPDYRRVIPAQSNTCVELDSRPVLRFATVAGGFYGRPGSSLFGGRGEVSRPVKISASEKGILLETKNPETGDSAVEIEAEGPKFPDFGVNLSYLAKIVRALGGKRVRIEPGEEPSMNPLVLRDATSLDNGFVVLMPMRV